jgi:peptidoglycan-N-acetylglucosamine deacetylase
MKTAGVHHVLPPHRSAGTHPATVVFTRRATLWLVGAFTLVGLAMWLGLDPLALAHQITPRQAAGRIISRGNPHLPDITLTFDDGPNPPYTSHILAILRQFGLKATFFCIGLQAAAHPELVKQEYAAGDTIGNHTWSHPSLPKLSAVQILAQLTMTSAFVQNSIGMRPRFFRPPYGALDAQVLAQVNRLGLTTILWSVDPQDWSRPGVKVIISRVLSQTGNGAIILLHDGGGNRSQTVAALPPIIETLQHRDFHFVPLQKLVADLNESTLALAAKAKERRDPASAPQSPFLFALGGSERRRHVLSVCER